MTKMELSLGFSVELPTTRGPHEGEVNGKDYHFLPPKTSLKR